MSETTKEDKEENKEEKENKEEMSGFCPDCDDSYLSGDWYCRNPNCNAHFGKH
jgi:hypothetical protein